MEFDLLKTINNYLLNFITEERKNKFFNNLLNRTRYLTIAIEDTFQSHNASAVLRTCECFGIQDIHIIENKNPYKVNDEVAMGSSKWLSINKYSQNENNTLTCIQALKNKGYKIAATTPHKDDVLLHQLPVDNKIAVIFGTELNGLSETAMQNADFFMKIPMYGFTESFNISVSAGIVIHHLSERIRSSDLPWQLSHEEREILLHEWLLKTISSGEELLQYFLKTQARNEP